MTLFINADAGHDAVTLPCAMEHIGLTHVLAPAGDVKPVAHIKHDVIPAVAVGDVTL